MKFFNSGSLLSDPKSKSCLCSLFITLSLICGVYLAGGAWLRKDSIRSLPGFEVDTRQHDATTSKCEVNSPIEVEINKTRADRVIDKCDVKCRPIGSEVLPKGIVSLTSNLEMRPLWSTIPEEIKSKNPSSLLAIAVGISQKLLVSKIVEKFLADDFVVMLFHYDGFVDKWHDLGWSDRVIHVSVKNQTKWWFAKRFLHPDIVAEYEYIFLWDEDLKVENFNPRRYISIIKEEGLEISQPALDPGKSEVYHPITARRRRSRVHRRYYKFKGGARCDANSTTPPCVGWVEMMAPVFSNAAWRCAWYMIQNDLIHAWGLDVQLGYCAQGDRTVKVGVVDEQYVVHLGLPTLGGFLGENNKKTTSAADQYSGSKNESVAGNTYSLNGRASVRRQSYNEMMIFKKRWNNAVQQDKCWLDPYNINQPKQAGN